MLSAIKLELKRLANPQKSTFLAGYFKTGKGEYAQGDIFLGLTVPQTRKIALKFKELPLTDIEKLLQSKIHEERQVALMILVRQFVKAEEQEQKKIYEFYVTHTHGINNWDLVDGSAPIIVGEYLLNKPIAVLEKLARSKVLWEIRIAIL